MDVLKKAKVVRLRTNDRKYLTASEDKKLVSLQKTTLPESNANWAIERITSHNAGEDKLQLWSCYHKTLQITSMMGTVRQIENGKQSWFTGWEARPSTNSSTSTSTSTRANALRLCTCKCFLEARDRLKLVLESVAADRGNDYELDWFVEVVETVDDPHESGTGPVRPSTDKVATPSLRVTTLKDSGPPSNSNLVVVNYHVDSSQLGAVPLISHLNSGRNTNGSGIQKNGDVNVQYEITTGRDINISFN